MTVGCNPSFIALIPKVPDAKFVKDFRPISLIDCQYKIIAKILANRLKMVIGDLVSTTQSAFVAGRQTVVTAPMEVNENRRTEDEGVDEESMETNTISGNVVGSSSDPTKDKENMKEVVKEKTKKL
ncbi:hypothetical protein LXL04_020447 [Taraxacum kok-saghyz]